MIRKRGKQVSNGQQFTKWATTGERDAECRQCQEPIVQDWRSSRESKSAQQVRIVACKDHWGRKSCRGKCQCERAKGCREGVCYRALSDSAEVYEYTLHTNVEAVCMCCRVTSSCVQCGCVWSRNNCRDATKQQDCQFAAHTFAAKESSIATNPL